MRIAILGRTEILYDTTCLLWEQGHEVGAIITAKAAPEYKRAESDFEELARVKDVPYRYDPQIGKTGGLAFLQRCGPFDLGISFNYPNIITQEVINLFPLGILNGHGDYQR